MLTHEMIFQERQQFRPWWMWFSLLPCLPLLYAALGDIMFYWHGASDPSAHASGALYVLPIWVAASYFFLFRIFLDTRIDNQGVSVKYTPFSSDFILFAWHEIDKAYVRKFNPIGEYGGWGFQKQWPRFSGSVVWGKKCNISYTVWGNKGLQLVLTDGSRVLIGICDVAGVERTLQSLGRL